MTGDSPATTGPFVGEPDGDGFRDVWFGGEGFNASLGTMQVRGEGEARARVRIPAGHDRANIGGNLHGGFLLGFLDQALFLGPAAIGRLDFALAVTLTVSTQFVGAGAVGVPLDCVLDITAETGRMMFLSGYLEQEERRVLSWQATLRKLTRRPVPQA